MSATLYPYITGAFQCESSATVANADHENGAFADMTLDGKATCHTPQNEWRPELQSIELAKTFLLPKPAQ